jgi:hypothetical protein
MEVFFFLEAPHILLIYQPLNQSLAKENGIVFSNLDQLWVIPWVCEWSPPSLICFHLTSIWVKLGEWEWNCRQCLPHLWYLTAVLTVGHFTSLFFLMVQHLVFLNFILYCCVVGTLWHLQKFLQCIKYIILEFTPSILLLLCLFKVLHSVTCFVTLFPLSFPLPS